jgi:hypothetical protein
MESPAMTARKREHILKVCALNITFRLPLIYEPRGRLIVIILYSPAAFASNRFSTDGTP